MFIPQGDWVVVMRHCRDTTSRGVVIKAGLPEKWAKDIAKKRSAESKDFNYWAMPKSEY